MSHISHISPLSPLSLSSLLFFLFSCFIPCLLISLHWALSPFSLFVYLVLWLICPSPLLIFFILLDRTHNISCQRLQRHIRPQRLYRQSCGHYFEPQCRKRCTAVHLPRLSGASQHENIHTCVLQSFFSWILFAASCFSILLLFALSLRFLRSYSILCTLTSI